MLDKSLVGSTVSIFTNQAAACNDIHAALVTAVDALGVRVEYGNIHRMYDVLVPWSSIGRVQLETPPPRAEFSWTEMDDVFALSLGDQTALISIDDRGQFDAVSEWNDAMTAFFGEDEKYRLAARAFVGGAE